MLLNRLQDEQIQKKENDITGANAGNNTQFGRMLLLCYKAKMMVPHKMLSLTKGSVIVRKMVYYQSVKSKHIISPNDNGIGEINNNGKKNYNIKNDDKIDKQTSMRR